MTEAWCPTCEATTYVGEGFENGEDCSTCVGPTTDHPIRLRVRRTVGKSVALALGLLIFLGPPAYTAYLAMTRPLFGTKTVTVTQTVPTGAISQASLPLTIWALAIVVVVIMPIMPGRI